jgi:hypothetical protein
MEGFKVTTTLGQADWRALMQALAQRANDRMGAWRPGRWILVGLWLGVAALAAFGTYLWPGRFDALSLLAAVALFFVIAWVIGMRQRRAAVPADDGIFMGTMEFVFEPDYFEITRAHSKSHNGWGLVRDVTHTATHVVLWVDHVSAYIFRVADLPAPLTVQDAVARLRAFVAAARPGADARFMAESAATTVPAAPSAAAASASVPDSPAGSRPTVLQELRALFRLETMRSVEPAHLYGRDFNILLFTLLAFALWLGATRLGYTGETQFMWYALPGVSIYLVLGLLPAWVLSRFSSPMIEMRRTALLVAAAAPAFVIVVTLAQYASGYGVHALVAMFGIWVALLWGRGVRVMSGRRQWRALAATAAGIALIFIATSHVYVGADLWFQDDGRYDPSSEESAAREDRLFEQGTRIDAQIAAMAPAEPQRGAMYFVGFAGYGEQRVFAEEIATAARTVDAKYGSGRRQVLLVNDRRDDEKYPLASVPALRHALASLGRRMNRDEDVLFLALSSHGSEDATLTVQNEDVMMFWRDLGAADLRTMLDESGIRWRVIVISACHSGSFIESLADDHTIVITAAAKENTSFGCSDDRDLTYFGEAFYRDALPEATSLRAAFEAAKQAIAERERAERRKPSDPQAHFGPALEQKLEAMQ